MALAGRDPGAGDEQQKSSLQHSLRTELIFEGMDYYVVQQVASEIESQYLTRWSVSLRTNARSAPERTAGAIATYLLDRGFSRTFLHRWWSFKLRYENGTASCGHRRGCSPLAMAPAKSTPCCSCRRQFTKRQGWSAEGCSIRPKSSTLAEVAKFRREGHPAEGRPSDANPGPRSKRRDRNGTRASGIDGRSCEGRFGPEVRLNHDSLD